MGFASAWLAERTLFPQIIAEAPDKQTGIIVTIPACDEPDISNVLDSLSACIRPECHTEVLIVINAPREASETIIDNNRLTVKNIESWKRKNPDCFFRLFAFVADTGALSNWGVGMARKTVMDEAVRRFNTIDNPGGVILSLDADCLVENNYFISVFREFLKERERKACSLYFEHPVSGDDFNASIYKYIILYELHLRYYRLGLVYAGFPDSFHTVGSSMAVKALPYVRAGGMNRRQAGEDFYFIQKLVSAGGYSCLNSTTVFPSPRISSRVPFGTGASIGKLAEENIPAFFSYNQEAFKELRSLFDMVEPIFQNRDDDPGYLYSELPEGIRSFLPLSEWAVKIGEIKENTSGINSFRKRFFGWFNMFRIVKYLNQVHKGIFEKMPVEISAAELLTVMGMHIESSEPLDLLIRYRNIEKNR